MRNTYQFLPIDSTFGQRERERERVYIYGIFFFNTCSIFFVWRLGKKKKKRKINSILSRSIRLLVNIVIAIWKTCVRRTYVRKTRKKYKIVLAKFTNQVDEPRKKEKNTTEGPPSFNSYLRSMHDNEFLPFFFFFFFFQ